MIEDGLSLKFFKQLFCKHDYKISEKNFKGCNLSWSGDIVKIYDVTEQCSKCGHKWVDTGVYFPLESVSRNKKGWPVDKNGNELPMEVFNPHPGVL